MQLNLFDFENEAVKSFETEDIPKTFIDEANLKNLSEDQLKRQINNLPLNADQKALIFRVSEFTITTGKAVISIGRRILELALLFFKRFPATSFGVVIGLVVSHFIPSGVVKGFAIPIVQSLLSLLKKIVILFAIGMGFKEDIQNTALSEKIAAAALGVKKSLGA